MSGRLKPSNSGHTAAIRSGMIDLDGGELCLGLEQALDEELLHCKKLHVLRQEAAQLPRGLGLATFP